MSALVHVSVSLCSGVKTHVIILKSQRDEASLGFLADPLIKKLLSLFFPASSARPNAIGP